MPQDHRVSRVTDSVARRGYLHFGRLQTFDKLEIAFLPPFSNLLFLSLYGSISYLLLPLLFLLCPLVIISFSTLFSIPLPSLSSFLLSLSSSFPVFSPIFPLPFLARFPQMTSAVAGEGVGDEEFALKEDNLGSTPLGGVVGGAGSRSASASLSSSGVRSAHLPAAGFTQRATIDPDLDEIHVLSGRKAMLCWHTLLGRPPRKTMV